MIGPPGEVKQRMSGTGNQLLPQPFWFRLALGCSRVKAMPKMAQGRLLNLPESCTLLDPAVLSGSAGWASVRAAWNDEGLGFAFRVDRPEGVRFRVNQKVVPAVTLWVDTRDTRTVHRATRFCHKFEFKLTPAGPRQFDVAVAQLAIPRALTNSPKTSVGSIRTWAESQPKEWSLEVWLPADALAGFDPESNRRFGLFYQVTDPDRGDHFAGVGREFPVGEDPSLWSTLTLDDLA